MKIFISGSMNITTLSDEAKTYLDEVCLKNNEILVGDCKGIDTLVQKYLNDKKYTNVYVYGSGDTLRNFLGEDLNWTKVYIQVPKSIYGRDFFTLKDKAMAMACDSGFAIWDGKSTGTLNNIRYLENLSKPVVVCQN